MSGLLQETRGTVRLLRFDNPARRNALSPALRMELLRALEAAECDPSIRSVLLTGGEEVFCAGGDLGDMRVTELAAGRARMQDNARLVRQMVRMGKPLIAAVEGWAVGPGCPWRWPATASFAAPAPASPLASARSGCLPTLASCIPCRRASVGGGHGRS